MSDVNVAPDAYRIRARECDPLSAKLAARGVRRASVMLLTTPVLMLSFTIANLMQGTLSHPAGGSVLVSDLQVVLRRADPQVVSSYFPLARDYPTILLFALVGAWLTVLFRQWRIMEEFLPSMLQSGAIEVVPGRETFLRHEVSRVNDTLVRERNQSRYVIGAIGLTACVLFAQTRAGIFGLLAPAGAGPEWANDAYLNWWGSLRHVPGFVAYYSAMAVAMYYLLRQNRVGVVWVCLFWRIRTSLKGHVDLTNYDRYNGWKPFRQLIYTVYWSMTATALALVAFLMVVSIRQWYWLSVFVVVFLILSPFYLAPPLLWVWRALDVDREELKQRIVGDCRALTRRRGPGDISRLVEIHAMVRMIREAKRLPFRFTSVAGGVIVYALPVAMAIVSLVSART